MGARRPDWSRDGSASPTHPTSADSGIRSGSRPVDGGAGGDPPAHLRQLRRDRAALVPGRHAHRLPRERVRRHGVRIIDVPGGAVQKVVQQQRRLAAPAPGRSRSASSTKRSRQVPARIAVQTEDGRSFAPLSAWMHADDGFDRLAPSTSKRTTSTPTAAATLSVPAGRVDDPRRGVASRTTHRARRRRLRPTGAAASSSPARRSRCRRTWSREWSSGDLRVHMSYAGGYRATPATLVAPGARRGPATSSPTSS